MVLRIGAANVNSLEYNRLFCRNGLEPYFALFGVVKSAANDQPCSLIDRNRMLLGKRLDALNLGSVEQGAEGLQRIRAWRSSWRSWLGRRVKVLGGVGTAKTKILRGTASQRGNGSQWCAVRHSHASNSPVTILYSIARGLLESNSARDLRSSLASDIFTLRPMGDSTL